MSQYAGHFRKAGLMVRASARFVEATAKAQDKRGWTQLSAVKLFPTADE